MRIAGNVVNIRCVGIRYVPASNIDAVRRAFVFPLVPDAVPIGFDHGGLVFDHLRFGMGKCAVQVVTFLDGAPELI